MWVASTRESRPCDKVPVALFLSLREGTGTFYELVSTQVSDTYCTYFAAGGRQMEPGAGNFVSPADFSKGRSGQLKRGPGDAQILEISAGCSRGRKLSPRGFITVLALMERVPDGIECF